MIVLQPQPLCDDIDGLIGEEEELANLAERLDKASTAYGMEINAEKTKLMTNNSKRARWRLFPRLREFWENVRPFLPCLPLFFLNWRSARAH